MLEIMPGYFIHGNTVNVGLCFERNNTYSRFLSLQIQQHSWVQHGKLSTRHLALRKCPPHFLKCFKFNQKWWNDITLDRYPNQIQQRQQRHRFSLQFGCCGHCIGRSVDGAFNGGLINHGRMNAGQVDRC